MEKAKKKKAIVIRRLTKESGVIIVVRLKREAYLKIKQYNQYLNPERQKESKSEKSTLWYQQNKIKDWKEIKVYNKTIVTIE